MDDAAHNQGIQVGMYDEMTGDYLSYLLLSGMGFHVLSMKAIIISGSSRSDGDTDKLVKQIQAIKGWPASNLIFFCGTRFEPDRAGIRATMLGSFSPIVLLPV